MRTNVPRAIRALRLKRGWRQSDLAARAACTRQVISRLETGRVDALKLRSLDAIVQALGGSLEVVVRWQGAALDRVLDAAHARLVETVVAQLQALGWETRVEVSFNHYGDRGRVDVLAYHQTSGTLLVVEVKSALGDVQDTLGRIDVKVRLGWLLADSVGWPRPRATLAALVLGDRRGARARVARHPAAFTRFPTRGRKALAWLRRPIPPPVPAGLLWFVNMPNVTPGSTTRVRRARLAQTRA
jgi:transcriptional regulator with XRE-family HTH domain